MLNDSALPISVQVWSDIACPWCYIGKRNLETARAAFAGEEGTAPIEVEFRSFELSPETPPDFGGNTVDYLVARKGISPEQARMMVDRAAAAGSSAGLVYDYETLRPTNTAAAHRLSHYAKARGAQDDMVERLFRAHFTEGRHLGDAEILADIAEEAGLDRDDVLRALAEGDYTDGFEEDKALAAAYGISGVPFFVFEDRYALSGAQPPEAFRQVLDHILAERS